MQVFFEINNTKTKIIGPSEAIKLASDALSYTLPGANHIQRNLGYNWDGRVKLLKRDGTFPTGLIRDAAKALMSNFEIQIVDKRVRPVKQHEFDFKLPFEPRYYQTEAMEMVRSHARGVYVMGTGSGKSAVVGLIANELGVDTLIITPDLGLKEQLFDDMAKWFRSKDVRSSLVSKDIKSSKPIVVTNIDSLTSKDPKYFERFNLLITDEFHHCCQGDTLILTSHSGSKIKDIYERFHRKNRRGLNRGCSVVSWSGEDRVHNKVTNAFKYTVPKMLKVKIEDEDGKIKELLITGNHKVYTPDGMKEIGSMQVGDEVCLGYMTHADAMRKRSANKNFGKLSRGRIISIEEVGGEDVYDIEVDKTHNYVANGILVSNSAAKSYLKVNDAAKNAYYRYGLTGTLARTDGTEMNMYGVLSNVIYKKTTSDLIEEKFLVPAKIFIHQLKISGHSKKRWSEAYPAIALSEEFNRIVAYLAEKEIDQGNQTLILVRLRAHGEMLKMILKGKAVYLNGDDDVKYRDEQKALFVARKIKCLIATNILGEGQNIPNIDVLINARLQKSEIQTFQGIGRALRKIDGKEIAIVHDFSIQGNRAIYDHSLERIMDYRSERAFQIIMS